MFSAARILAIRKRRGFSQEMLAELSGVSLRTIQRVEQGETVPRGYTLHALAEALGVSLDDFRPEPAAAPTAPPTAPLSGPDQAPFFPLPRTPNPEPFTTFIPALLVAPDQVVPAIAPLRGELRRGLRSDPDFLQLLNLSALSLLVLPLLNILVPFLLWRQRRHTILHAAEVGRRVLGFQILWQVGCFLAYALLFGVYQGANALHLPLWKGGFVAVFIGSYLLNVLTVLYYAGRLKRGDRELYRFRL